MGYYPATPIGSGSGGSGKPKESSSGGVQSGYYSSPSSGGGGGGSSSSSTTSSTSSNTVTQQQFEEQVQAYQVATGSTSKQAAVEVRNIIARGERVTTDPTVLSRLRSERTQANFEEQVQAYQVATGSTGKEAASVVRSANARGEYITTDPKVLTQLREQRLQQATQPKRVHTIKTQAYNTGGNYQLLPTPAPPEAKGYSERITPTQPKKGIITRAGEYVAQTRAGQYLSNNLTNRKPPEKLTYGYLATRLVPVGATGSTLGTAGNLIKSGASKGVRVISKVTPSLARFSPVERFLVTTGISIGGGVVGVEGGKVIARTTASKEQKEIYSTPGYRDVVKEASRQRDIAVQELPFYKQLAADVVPIYRPTEATYEKSLREQFQQRGLSPSDVETGVKAVKRERTGATYGEVGALLNVGRSSETLGRSLVGNIFLKSTGTKILKEKAGREVAKRAVLPIALAGFQEGVATELVQTRSRERTLNAKSVGLSGLFGAASAGLIGGAISGTAPNYPKASKVISFLAYTTDPYEYPGDVLADVTEGVLIKAGRRIAPTPVLTPVYNPSKPKEVTAYSIGTSTEPGFRFPNILKTTPQTRPTVQTRTTVQTNTNVPGIITEIQNNILINPPTKTPSNTPTNTNTPTKTPSNTPTNPPTNTFIGVEPDVPPDTPAEIPVPVNIPPNTNIGVPISVPYFGLPPPLPLGFPGGSVRGLGKDSRRYINELSVAFGVVPRGNTVQVSRAKPRAGIFGKSSLFAQLYTTPKLKRRKK